MLLSSSSSSSSRSASSRSSPSLSAGVGILLLLLTTAVTTEGWLSPCRPSAKRNRRPALSMSSSPASSSSPSSPSSAAVNNNVVLTPSSDDGDRFDSYKIGGARVHRYRGGDDPEDGEIEYVMWYHGRQKSMDDDDGMPPLSTGRIGRATSRNGLAWVKDREGSVSEDAPDVSLGLNKDSWWGFDTSHVGLGNVLMPMSTPAVLTDGGVYLMYYMGGSYEETPAGDYIGGGAKLPDALANKKMKGMKMRIGVALSQDGITWGRVEGDDPTGACVVPYDPDDRNIDSTTVPPDMDEELYAGWPEVVVNLPGEDGDGDNKKKKDGGRENFLMYYSTMTAGDKRKCIARAVSEDGFRWMKRGVCLRPSAGDEGDDVVHDANGCARCCVVRDAEYDDETGSWREGGGDHWNMYYEGVSPVDNKHRVMMAGSNDGGVTWTKLGVALDVGHDENAWDYNGVGSPHVIRMDDGSLRMYYTGQGADGSTAIGVARLVKNDDGDDGDETGKSSSSWVREQATISFS